MDDRFDCPRCGLEIALDPKKCTTLVRFEPDGPGRVRVTTSYRVRCAGCGEEGVLADEPAWAAGPA